MADFSEHTPNAASCPFFVRLQLGEKVDSINSGERFVASSLLLVGDTLSFNSKTNGDPRFEFLEYSGERLSGK